MNILEDFNFTLLENFSKTPEGQYSKYVKDHIENVQKAYKFIKDNLPELLDELEISVKEMDQQIEHHDKTKWSSIEFGPYADHWYGNNGKEREDHSPEYDAAWKHHYENNPHHEEFWKKKEMPYSCILELICDWLSFSIKKGDLSEIKSFWDDKIEEKKEILHPKTVKKIDEIINKIDDSTKKYSNIELKKLTEMFENNTLLEGDFFKIEKLMDVGQFKQIESMIRGSQKILIVRHISPDADAMGAAKAMEMAIRKKYPKKEVILGSESMKIDMGPNDLIIILDLGVTTRIACEYTGQPKSVRIDHHKTGLESDVTIELPEAGSTSELVTLFLKHQKYDIDRKMAEGLFKGIITDTGRMQYSLSDTTLAATSILKDIGIDYKKIYNQMYVKDDISLKSKAYILSNYKTTPNGVAYLFLDRERTSKAGIDMNKTSQQVYEMGEIKGCPIWVIISEKGKDNITMRVRSRVIPIDEVSERFGGGGHKNACGIKVENRSRVKDILIALDKEIADYRKQHGGLLENFKLENDRISKFNKEYRNIANSFGFAFNIPRNLDPSFSLIQESPMKLRDRLREMTGDEITFIEQKQLPEKKNCIAMVFNQSIGVPYTFYAKINNEWYCKDKVGSTVRNIPEKEMEEIFNAKNKSPYFMVIKKTLIETVNVKGKTLNVELDANIDLNDEKTHFIKSKDFILKLTKKGTNLNVEVEVKKEKNNDDRNIELYNKKLPIDIKRARQTGVPNNIAETIFEALAELSEKRIGAFLAFEGHNNLNKYCENGEKIHCPISKEIFMSIFYPGTDVHDGAVIIKNGIIKYASVFFKNIADEGYVEHYGARHRAAIGISKETDTICIIVSEETGNISFAVNGKFHLIKAADVKKSRNRFIKLFNDNIK